MFQFYNIGNYIEDITPLINMIDLLDIEGKEPFQDRDYIYMDVNLYHEFGFLFKTNSNYKEWISVLHKYQKDIYKDPRKRGMLIHEQKIKLKKDLKEWIRNNVRFD
jgi:spore coat protein CotH